MMSTVASTEVRRQNPIVLSVAMPAYNEEANIERVVLDHIRVLESLQGTIADWEIVCLDDASTDRTLSILQELAARIPRLKVLRHLQNKGIFESMNDVSRSARGTHVCLTASDGQWPAENLIPLLDAVIDEHADLAIWVRRNRWRVYSLRRWIVSFLFNLLPWILFGTKTTDAGSVKLGLRTIYAFDLISRSPFAEAERILVAQRGVPDRLCACRFPAAIRWQGRRGQPQEHPAVISGLLSLRPAVWVETTEGTFGNSIVNR